MADRYAATVSTACVGQVAYIVGFDHVHTDALHAASGVMMRFIKEVGLYAKEAAELQGRTDVNVLDVVRIVPTMYRYICSERDCTPGTRSLAMSL
jgi:histone H3/H4